MQGSLMLAPIILIATSNFSSLHSGADTRASDNSDMNPFMLAIEKCHLEVVKMMMEKDPGLMSMPMGSRSTVIQLLRRAVIAVLSLRLAFVSHYQLCYVLNLFFIPYK